MQILQWLFRGAHDQQGRQDTTTNKDQEHQSKAITLTKNRRSSKSKKFKPFMFLCSRDVAKACFYSTIYLRRSSPGCGSCDRRKRCADQSLKMKMKKEDIMSRGLNVSTHKSDSATQTAGNKVRPLSEATLSSSISTNEKKDKLIKGDKTKTLSRMKELLRWAAAPKSGKGSAKVIGRKDLPLRNRGAVKAVADDDRRFSNESPKISFRWDSESRGSSTSSAFSVTSSSSRNDQSCNIASLNSTPIQGLSRCSSRRGNWITTDSEFVVLELC